MILSSAVYVHSVIGLVTCRTLKETLENSVSQEFISPYLSTALKCIAIHIQSTYLTEDIFLLLPLVPGLSYFVPSQGPSAWMILSKAAVTIGDFTLNTIPGCSLTTNTKNSDSFTNSAEQF